MAPYDALWSWPDGIADARGAGLAPRGRGRPVRLDRALAGAGHMDETEELIRLMARASVAQMSHAPGFELHMTRDCVLALTGEPLADFNTLSLGSGPHAEAFLTRSVDRVRARRLPLLTTMSPHVAEALAPAAAKLGLTAAGTAPLMVRRASASVRPTRAIKVDRAVGPELVAIVGDIVAAAFGAPREAVARGIDAGITATSDAAWYLGWSDDRPVSVVCVTPAGDTAGIFSMGTLPAHQRQGAGGALLAQVIDRYRARGVGRFYLVASDAGRPLYASLGFAKIADLSAWVLGHSTQVGG
jgi:GNAT superfamily N-acetyltransferase